MGNGGCPHAPAPTHACTVLSMALHASHLFRYFQTNRGETVERREVKWGTLYVNYEPTDVPSE